jgi:hypothetical protein
MGCGRAAYFAVPARERSMRQSPVGTWRIGNSTRCIVDAIPRRASEQPPGNDAEATSLAEVEAPRGWIECLPTEAARAFRLLKRGFTSPARGSSRLPGLRHFGCWRQVGTEPGSGRAAGTNQAPAQENHSRPHLPLTVTEP